MQHKG